MHLIRFAGLSMLVMLGMMPARAAPAPDHWLATLNAVWGGTWAIEKNQFMFSSFDNEENWSDGTVSEPSDLPVFTPAWKKIYDYDRAQAIKGNPVTDFTGACIPYGFPLMEFFPIQLQFADGSFNVLTMDRFYRHVDLTRTSHPAGLSPGYDGDSIGHWEGDTLVIDTVGLRTDTLIELGLTHSPALHVLERLHKAGPDRLQVDYVFRDPVAFARDWHVAVTYDRTSNSLSTDAGEEPCQLNRNGLDAKGNIVFLGSDGKSLTDYK